MLARTRIAAALIAAVALVAQGPAQAQGQTDMTLRMLAERLARDSGVGPADFELDVGTIPTLPVAFVPPPQARILGTVIERPQGNDISVRPVRYRVYFTMVKQAPQALVDAVSAAVANEGYTVRPLMFGPVSGGLPHPDAASANLCSASVRSALFVRARRFGEATDAVLEELAPAPRSSTLGWPCDAMRAADPAATLPILRSAPAVTVAMRANSVAPGIATETADVFTSLSPRTVVEGWAAQAVAAGWTQRSIVSTDAIATASLSSEMSGVRLLVISLVRVRSGQYYASLTNVTTPAEPTSAPVGQ